MAFFISHTVTLLFLTTLLQVCRAACVYNCTPVYSLWYLWLLVLGVIICVCGLCGHCYRRRVYARSTENAETIQVNTANVNVTGVTGYYMNPDGTSSPVAPYPTASPVAPYPVQVPPPYVAGGPPYAFDPNMPNKMAYAAAPPSYADAIKTHPVALPASSAPVNAQNDYSTANISTPQNTQNVPLQASAPSQHPTGQETIGQAGHQNMGYEHAQ